MVAWLVHQPFELLEHLTAHISARPLRITDSSLWLLDNGVVRKFCSCAGPSPAESCQPGKETCVRPRRRKPLTPFAWDESDEAVKRVRSSRILAFDS